MIRNEEWGGNKEAKDGLMSFLASRCTTYGSVVQSLGLKYLLLFTENTLAEQQECKRHT